MKANQQRQLPLGRKGSLRLVKQVKSFSPETVLHKGQKAFPMRLLMEGTAAVLPVIDRRVIPCPVFFYLGCYIVKALCPQEKMVLRLPPSLAKPHAPV